MRFRSFRTILDECVAAVQHGATVEECLARYPRHAQRLKPLLALAERIRRTPGARPRPWAQTTAWNAVRLRAADLRAGKRRGGPIQVSFGWMKPLALVFALLVAVGAGGGATAFASQDALPNDTLYPVKLFTEDVHVWLTFDDTSRANLLLDQSAERMQEIATLVSRGDTVPDNVLSALRNRNQDAQAIIVDHPEQTVLLDRSRRQAESQERTLVALWEQIDGAARNEYTSAVAQIHNSRLGGQDARATVLQPEDLEGGIGTITGKVDAVGDGVWSVGGYEIRVDARTIGALGIEPGSTATFTVGHSVSGKRYALSASLKQTGEPPSQAVVYGQVEEVTEDGVRIAGQFIPMTPETLKKLQIRKGEAIQVSVHRSGNGVVATEVSGGASSFAAGGNRTLLFEGVITVAGDAESGEWDIGGLTFADTPQTLLDLTGGPAVEGARALVEAKWSGDKLTAQSITILKSDASDSLAYLVGTFEGTRSGVWVVSGLTMTGSSAAAPEEGSLVAIDATEEGGVLTVKQAQVITGPKDKAVSRFKGTAIAIEGSTWSMEIGDIRVRSTTKISGKPLEGTRALVWYGPNEGILQAVYVHVLDKSPVVEPAAPATP